MTNANTIMPMTALEFRQWRQTFDLTQDDVSKMFNVTRNTVQNWEGAVTALPSTIGLACEVWTDRLRKQTAALGPVTLCYTDGPMFLDPYGPRRGRIAMLQQEAYPTNAAALARVRKLWGRDDFHGPFVMEKSGKALWNSVELMRVADGSDKTAPTVSNVISKVGEYVEKNAESTVRSGPRVPSPNERAANAQKVRDVAGELRKLSEEAEMRAIEWSEFEALLVRLRALGFFPTNRQVGDVACVIESEKLAQSYAS